MGDLILTEVLQGFGSEKDFNRARKILKPLPVIQLCDRHVAIKAATNHRKLRALGVTVRKTIDTVIATRCMESGLALLHSDRDFDAFGLHLGLSVVQCRSPIGATATPSPPPA